MNNILFIIMLPILLRMITIYITHSAKMCDINTYDKAFIEALMLYTSTFAKY